MARFLTEESGGFSRARSSKSAKQASGSKQRRCASPIERLAKHMTVDPHTSCHIPKVDCSKNGYACIRVRNEDGSYSSKRAIRIVMANHLGRELHEDEVVRHHASCPRACCNPEHLTVGTRQQNAQDARDAGAYHVPRLTKAKAIAIADALCAGVQSGERLIHLVSHIAHEYGVKHQAIYQIWKGKTHDCHTRMSERRLKVASTSNAILGQVSLMLQKPSVQVQTPTHLH